MGNTSPIGLGQVLRQMCSVSSGHHGSDFLPHTASEKLVLACIAEKPSVTIEQLAQKTGISRSGVRYVLNRLREKGRLRREGPQKGGQWIIKTDTDK